MPLALPPLPYPYGALEPTIDDLTMRIHHDKHHGGYVAGLNAALEGTAWADRPVDELLGDLDALPGDKRTLVRNNGGGHLNHSLFWESMAPDDHGLPADPLAEAIEATFGSIRELKRQVSAAGALRQRLVVAGPRCHRPRGHLHYLEAWWNVVDWQRVAARYATAASRNAGGDHP